MVAGIHLSTQELEYIAQYLCILQRWNQTYNLTAVREQSSQILYHIIDSLSIRDWIEGDTVLDFGSGAGLPGIPLAIVLSDKRFTLLDSNGKKARFLRHVVRTLALENVYIAEKRMEDMPQKPVFDTVTVRAVTGLQQIYRLCKPVLTTRGKILAMKGSVECIPDDLKDISEAMQLSVPELLGDRSVVVMK